MAEPVTTSFSDTVRRMGKKQGEERYTVTFRRHAAIYHIDGKREDAIAALTASSENTKPVQVTCNAVSSEILDVSPAP
jgi:hypothetical protein